MPATSEDPRRFPKMSLAASIRHSLKLLYFYLGYRLYILVALNLISVAAESFGIVLLIPFFKTLEIGVAGSDHISASIVHLFSLLHLEVSLGNTLLLMVAAFTFKAAMLFSIAYYKQYLCASLGFDLAQQLVKGYANLEYSYSRRIGSRFLVNVLGVEISNALAAINALCQTISCCITTMVFVGTVLFIHPQLSLVTAFAGLLSLYLLQNLSLLIRSFSQATLREHQRLNNLSIELLHASKYLKATAGFAILENLIRESGQRALSIERQHALTNAGYHSIREPMNVMLLAGVVYYYIVVQGQSFAIIVVPLLFLYRCLQEFNFLQSSWLAVCSNSAAFAHVHDTLCDFKAHQDAIVPRQVVSLSTSIRFDSVSFSYDSFSVFRNLNIEISRHSTVALVGHSGAGKTTFVDLATGILKPQEGKVLIDEVPLSAIDLPSFQRKIGYVTQEAVMFSDTIANNISMQLGSTPDRETMRRIREVARMSHVEEFVEKLSDGYHTDIGEHGYRLSGGQRQRVAIARELYRSPELLIFDEATSALDAHSEFLIQQSLQSLRGRVTILIISHRLSTIEAVDRILLIEDGRIVEDDTPSALMAGNSQFRKLYRLQAVV